MSSLSNYSLHAALTRLQGRERVLPASDLVQLKIFHDVQANTHDHRPHPEFHR